MGGRRDRCARNVPDGNLAVSVRSRGSKVKIRELSQTEWTRFLEEFSRDHHGWLAAVERRLREGSTPIVRKAPLVGIHLEASGGTPTLLVVLHPQEDPQNSIRLERPRTVRVHETDEGLPQYVEIDSDRGHVIVRLGGVLPPNTLLDGVAPGELS
jgi:hypothetical protein